MTVTGWRYRLAKIGSGGNVGNLYLRPVVGFVKRLIDRDVLVDCSGMDDLHEPSARIIGIGDRLVRHGADRIKRDSRKASDRSYSIPHSLIPQNAQMPRPRCIARFSFAINPNPAALGPLRKKFGKRGVELRNCGSYGRWRTQTKPSQNDHNCRNLQIGRFSLLQENTLLPATWPNEISHNRMSRRGDVGVQDIRRRSLLSQLYRGWGVEYNDEKQRARFVRS